MTTAEWIGRLLMPFDDIPSDLKEGKGEILKLRKEKEIISAVEWLEQELNALFQIKGTEMDEQEEIVDKIHKAFQDVIKK